MNGHRLRKESLPPCTETLSQLHSDTNANITAKFGNQPYKDTPPGANLASASAHAFPSKAKQRSSFRHTSHQSAGTTTHSTATSTSAPDDVSLLDHVVATLLRRPGYTRPKTCRPTTVPSSGDPFASSKSAQSFAGKTVEGPLTHVPDVVTANVLLEELHVDRHVADLPQVPPGKRTHTGHTHTSRRAQPVFLLVHKNDMRAQLHFPSSAKAYPHRTLPQMEWKMIRREDAAVDAWREPNTQQSRTSWHGTHPASPHDTDIAHRSFAAEYTDGDDDTVVPGHGCNCLLSYQRDTTLVCEGCDGKFADTNVLCESKC